MSENNRSFRLKANLDNVQDNVSVPLNLIQDNDTFEFLSLKIDTENFYKLHTSKYGCIVGRVLANDAVGIPNVRVSVFVKAKEEYESDGVISSLYPYNNIYSKDRNNIRYNLLPEEKVSECHTPVGTMPSKRMVLDDDNVVEVYDNYYKFSTVTNKSGDYMIFGVPVGDHIVHSDLDLSDIGFLSQRPRDMVYKGYDVNKFDNANKFKGGTNLDALTQIISQNDSVNVIPFWGEYTDDDDDAMPIGITRNDISIQYEFTPTCVFMGSIITDTSSEGVSRKCIASERMGKMDKLTTGAGTIEMIRKTPDGAVEEFQINGTQLIDGTGTWCYQIPMNLDFVKTDEYGNIVPSEDPNKGIPTRAMVRFRISLNDFESDFGSNHLTKVLVPNNPTDPSKMDNIYNFGSLTPDECFKELFWNNVYSVKSFIPRIQKGNSQNNKRFTGIKSVNINGANNSIPYNNIRIKLSFSFKLQCAIIKAILWITKFINSKIFRIFIIRSNVTCLLIGDGLCPDLEGWYFAPGCEEGSHAWREAWRSVGDTNFDPTSNDETNKDVNETVCMTNQTKYLMECIEMNLAQEYEVINFDFYNDWLNGTLYIPRWFGRIRKKKKYVYPSAENKLARKKKIVYDEMQFCSENYYYRRRYTQQCSLTYKGDSEGFYTDVITDSGCSKKGRQKCHRSGGRRFTGIFEDESIHGGGLARPTETLRGDTVYYYKPCEWKESYDGTFENKCNLFATDIILLGSLNECDENGIPMAYKYLKSSTYVMPSNLAKTNMDEEGYMYMLSGGDGTSICNNKKTDSELTLKKPQTFENYATWSKRKEYYEKNPDDITEYAVTESAGISWGYTGPNQESEYKKIIDENNLLGEELYNPGGHFLDMACTDKNTKTNIKTCVNLSRICELGSNMSSREYILLRDGENIKYSYIQPNGLISKDELDEEGEFREMFATMNINSLKTVMDENTGYRRYEFISMKPNNFFGELRNRIPYFNNFEASYDDQNNGRKSDAKLFVRSLEDMSKDYYCYRFGLTKYPLGREMMKHYLIYNVAENSVSLPVYENSFYFYFGLMNGSTALDKFYDKFYASCEDTDKDKSYFTYKLENASYCSSVDATLDIAINDVETPYSIKLSRGGTKLYFYDEYDDDGNKTVVAVTNEGGRSPYKVMFYDDNGILRTDYIPYEKYAKNETNKYGVRNFIYEKVVDTYTTNDHNVFIKGLHGSFEGIPHSLYFESNDGENREFLFKVMTDRPKLNGINIITSNFTIDIDMFESEQLWKECVNLNKSGNENKEYGHLTVNGYSGLIGGSNEGIVGFVLSTDSEYVYTVIDSVKNIDENILKNLFSLIGVESITNLGNFSSSEGGFSTYLWSGNNDYKLYAIYYCPNYDGGLSEKNYMYQGLSLCKIDTFSVSAPIDLDIYVYDSDLRFNKTISKFINAFPEECNRDNWWAFLLYKFGHKDVFPEGNNKIYVYREGNEMTIKDKYVESDDNRTFVASISKKQVWNIKKALYYQPSVYESASPVNIRAGAIGGKIPYKEIIFGTPEREFSEEITLKDVKSTECAYFSDISIYDCFKPSYEIPSYEEMLGFRQHSENEGYELSLNNIIIPTYGFDMAFGNFRQKGYTKRDIYGEYGFSVDGDNEEMLFKYGADNRDYPISCFSNVSYSQCGPKCDYGICVIDGSKEQIPIPITDENIMNHKNFLDIRYDRGGYSTSIKGVDKRLFLSLPSIYMPFFFNVNFVIDEKDKITCNYYINNGITSDGRFGEVSCMVNSKVHNIDYDAREEGDLANVKLKDCDDYKQYFNRYDIRYGNEPSEYEGAYCNYNSFIKGHKEIESEGIYNDDDTNVFSFNVNESDPGDTDDVYSINEAVSVLFPLTGNDNFYFSDNIAFCYVKKNDIGYIKDIGHMMRTYCFYGEYLKSEKGFELWEDGDEEGHRYNETYSGIASRFIEEKVVFSYNLDKKINNIIYEYEYDEEGNSTGNKAASGYVLRTLYNIEYFANDDYIVAICDPLTRNSEYRSLLEEGDEEEKENEKKKAYNYITKDTNLLSVCKLYNIKDFSDMIKDSYGLER